jgi:hypothetical protein
MRARQGCHCSQLQCRVCRVCLQVPATQGCDASQLGEMCNDDLAHIGSRYGVSLSDLLWWNPDLQGRRRVPNPSRRVPNPYLSLKAKD